MTASRFIQSDREAEGLSAAISEAIDQLSDREGLQRALANDEQLSDVLCELLSWGCDRMLGQELRAKHMSRLADSLERHVRLKAEREFNGSLVDADEDAEVAA